MVWRIIQIGFTGLLFLYGAVTLVLDMVGYLDTIEKHVPWLGHVMKRREILFALLVVGVGLLIRDFKDAMAIAPPPIVKITPPSAPQSSDNLPAKRTRIEEIRKGLAALIRKGVSIRDRTTFTNDPVSPELLSDWHKWTAEVDHFLRKNLDSADAETFKSYDQGNMVPLRHTIMNEIGALENIVDHLGH